MFSDWLRETRQARDLSQGALVELARAADAGARLYQTRISEYERGVAIPSLRQLRAIFAALQSTESEIVAGRSEWERAQLTSTATPSPAQV